MTPNQGSAEYDAAGNMTTLRNGYTAVWDAWNRLVEVRDGQTIIQQHEYDGTGRRIEVRSDFTGQSPGRVEHRYHNDQQVIETRRLVDGQRSGGYQYLWSPRYIDAPILRDTLTTDGTSIVSAQRVFYLADANYNVTGLVKYDSGNGQWQVVERYSYTPYGQVTYRTADWSETASSANGNTVLYTGRTLDVLTSLYYYRARYYDLALERFISRDPLHYDTGDLNLYQYVWDNPVLACEPLGTLGYVPSQIPSVDSPMDLPGRLKPRPVAGASTPAVAAQYPGKVLTPGDILNPNFNPYDPQPQPPVWPLLPWPQDPVVLPTRPHPSPTSSGCRPSSRPGDWLDCMAACIQDNDPLPYAIVAAVKVALLYGGWQTKWMAAQASRAMGYVEFAEEILHYARVPDFSKLTNIIVPRVDNRIESNGDEGCLGGRSGLESVYVVGE